MSPVNDIGLEDEDEQALTRAEITQRIAAGVGASERMPLRLIILFAIVAVCVTVAPIPFNGVGVAALVMLALDTAAHRRV